VYQLSRGLDVAADVRKESAARGIPKPVIRVPVPRDCPHPLLVPVGVPLREYIRCLQRRLASRPGQAEANRIACDLQRARQRLVLEPAAPHLAQPNSSPVTETREFPLRFVCRVHARTKERGNSIGTGFLIHPRIVLTCAHVVFPPQARSKTVSVTVTPGQNGDATPLGGPLRAKAWLSAPDWNKSAPCEHDFALILLPQPSEVGAWPINSVAADDVMQVDVHHAGYPACQVGDAAKQMVRGVGQILGAVQYSGTCSLRTVNISGTMVPIGATTRTVAHNIPTCPSQSGGPLWIVDVCTRKPVAVAIHQGRIANGRLGRAIIFSLAIIDEIRALARTLLK
jgi:Trypsin-like peptidase domain